MLSLHVDYNELGLRKDHAVFRFFAGMNAPIIWLIVVITAWSTRGLVIRTLTDLANTEHQHGLAVLFPLQVHMQRKRQTDRQTDRQTESKRQTELG